MTFEVPGYDVVELLGFGGSGEVWLARELATGDLVALKRLHGSRDPAARERLRREAALLAGVAHPHVVRLRAVVRAGSDPGDPGDPVLVLDHAAGGSLAALLADRPRLGAGEVVTIAVGLAQALAAVHARGVVHGDVTPGNVLFAADGRPLLADLGVALLTGLPSDPHGTPHYVDPAVLAGGVPAPASDVYGLAAVCHRALAGRPAAPPPLVAALDAALDPDPAARPDAAAFARAVYAAWPATPVGLSAPTRRPAPTPRPPAVPPRCQVQAPRPRTPVPSGPAPGPGRTGDLAAPGGDPGEPWMHDVTRRVRPTSATGLAHGDEGGSSATSGGRGRRGRRRGGRRRAGPAAEVRRRGRGRRGGRVPWRALSVVVLGCAALVVAVLAGLAWAHGAAPGGGGFAPSSAVAPSPSEAAAVVEPGAASPDWGAVVRTLDRRRTVAFASTDMPQLSAVYVPESPALVRDGDALRRLVRSGLRCQGLRHDTRSVAVVRERADGVVLRVVDVLPGYALLDQHGATVVRRYGRGRATWHLSLRRWQGEWRVYDVVRA